VGFNTLKQSSAKNVLISYFAEYVVFILLFADHVVCMASIFAQLVIFSVYGFDLLSLK